jgi:hypothetical protein
MGSARGSKSGIGLLGHSSLIGINSNRAGAPDLPKKFLLLPKYSDLFRQSRGTPGTPGTPRQSAGAAPNAAPTVQIFRHVLCSQPFAPGRTEIQRGGRACGVRRLAAGLYSRSVVGSTKERGSRAPETCSINAKRTARFGKRALRERNMRQRA